MALPPALKDEVVVIVYTNLGNLISPTPTLVIPAGFERLFFTAITEYFSDLGLSPDITQVVKEVIANRINLTVIITP